MADETITAEAERLVLGPRQGSYGHPLDDFTRTGRMWGAILGVPDVPAEKVALCLAAVKLSREVNAPKRDNLVDLAGYALTASLVYEERKRRGDPLYPLDKEPIVEAYRASVSIPRGNEYDDGHADGSD